MQKYANLVELEKCCQTHIFLQNFVLIQPRTSPLKFCKFCKFANFADPKPTDPPGSQDLTPPVAMDDTPDEGESRSPEFANAEC